MNQIERDQALWDKYQEETGIGALLCSPELYNKPKEVVFKEALKAHSKVTEVLSFYGTPKLKELWKFLEPFKIEILPRAFKKVYYNLMAYIVATSEWVCKTPEEKTPAWFQEWETMLERVVDSYKHAGICRALFILKDIYVSKRHNHYTLDTLLQQIHMNYGDLPIAYFCEIAEALGLYAKLGDD